MADPGASSPAPQGDRAALEPPMGSIHQLSQPSQQSLALSQELEIRFAGWETIGEKRDFYDEQDCLHSSYNLASEKLQHRGRDDVVIFDYSLSPGYLSLDGDPPSEGEGRSPGRFSEDDDIFFKVSKDELTKSEQFNQIINPPKEPRLLQSRGRRLGIM